MNIIQLIFRIINNKIFKVFFMILIIFLILKSNNTFEKIKNSNNIPTRKNIILKTLKQKESKDIESKKIEENNSQDLTLNKLISTNTSKVREIEENNSQDLTLNKLISTNTNKVREIEEKNKNNTLKVKHDDIVTIKYIMQIQDKIIEESINSINIKVLKNEKSKLFLNKNIGFTTNISQTNFLNLINTDKKILDEISKINIKQNIIYKITIINIERNR